MRCTEQHSLGVSATSHLSCRLLDRCRRVSGPSPVHTWSDDTALCSQSCVRYPTPSRHGLAAQQSAAAVRCWQVLSGDHPSCPPALALLADVYAAQAYAAHAAGDARATAAARAAAALCFQHLLVADPLRGSYWRHCLAQLDASAQGCKKP